MNNKTYSLHTTKLIALVLGLGLCACSDGKNGAQGEPGLDGELGVKGPSLVRLVSAPLGAEFTGLFLNSDGTFFLNVQHPSLVNNTLDADGNAFNKGTIGAVVGADFNNLGKIAALDAPILEWEKELVITAVGRYQVLSQQDVPLADGRTMGDIVTANGTTLLKNSNNPEFNSAISDGGTGFFIYSNWEDRPGGMSRIHVDRLNDNGYQSVTQEGMLDFSSVKGTWVNCFGSLSPWGTPLTSEELFFDYTAGWYDSFNSSPYAATAYLGLPTDGSGSWANPYDYGYIVEIGTNNTAAAPLVTNVEMAKRYAMGRFSHENSIVMPDNKTVFLSDDGNAVVFFKFVADTAGDLSAGTLYAAKVTQTAGITDPAEAGFAIEWVHLAHGDESELSTIIRSYDGTFAEAKHITDLDITAWAEAKIGVDIDADGAIAANPFPDNRPAFLESRKAAVALGATGEFNKMEGVNINRQLANTWWNNGAADGPQAYMYMSMSYVGGLMTDSLGRIQLDGTHGDCGLVYRMKLRKNSRGETDVTHLIPALVGGPFNLSRSTNRCNINNIANPDNIEVLNDGRVLIAEDTTNHENNFVWLFNDPAI